MLSINNIHAREILDSRGNPTVEVDLTTEDGLFRAAVPSGASTGIHEALELRDQDQGRYLGKGVLKAIENINNIISSKIKGMDPEQQEEIDNKLINLDGTDNKSRLGANAILAVSMAVCRAGAAAKNLPLFEHITDLANTNKFILPIPFFNIINGGRHADNNLDFQEFMIAPTKSKSFNEAMRIGSEIYHNLKQDIQKKYGKGTTSVGDEGGFAPTSLNKAEQPLDMITETINNTGYKGKVKIAMDIAASEFYKNNKYMKNLNSNDLIQLYKDLIKNYPIISIEDPFDQDDWDAFAQLTKETKIQIVGDDFLVTNPKRIKNAIENKACNTLLLKINQIGTITESIKAHKLAKDAGWKTMVSHRSGETEDSFIADLAVGLGNGQIKSGAPCRSERLAKYNQLIRIEESLIGKCRYGK